ncbi:hypothetical protein KTH_61240 [Thermosporothrix hazakensis]|uniref:Uncharacterized protein n=1 Tax=Thermosporothrix sp. COM3 TaxID=2490863 RepID=A0A455SPD7_9CHLR|nr:hypothetical protein KTC_17150 [Thermosporothrix sp. COM3]GCE51255.1 hypothetical protein KTH_61240 [Thermosporothrix hazakensis]
MKLVRGGGERFQQPELTDAGGKRFQLVVFDPEALQPLQLPDLVG